MKAAIVLALAFAAWILLGFATSGRRRAEFMRRSGASPLGGPSGERAYIKARGFPMEWLGLMRELRGDGAAREAASRRIAQEGRVMLPMLRAFCREEGDDYRTAVHDLIDRLHPGGLAEGLAEGLRSGEPHEEMMSCDALADLGPKAAHQIPALVEFAFSGSPVADRAFSALGSMGPPGASAALDAFARHELDPEDSVVPFGMGELVEDAAPEDDATAAAEVMGKVLAVARSAALSARHRIVLAESIMCSTSLEGQMHRLAAVADDPLHPFARYARIVHDSWTEVIDYEEAMKLLHGKVDPDADAEGEHDEPGGHDGHDEADEDEESGSGARRT